MKPEILEIAKQKHISSGGSCGTSFVELTSRLNLTAGELEEILSEMYNDEQIEIRSGINGFLVMHKNNPND